MAMGAEAARRGIKVFVESSTGMVYKPDSTPRKETDKLKPWSKLAKWKLQAEEDLAKIPGLNLLVFRTAHVYGPYTSKFLGTALCMARVYQSLGKEMKWLWKEDLRTNTVHVEDVARGLWMGAEWFVQSKADSPRTFNLVDHGNTCKLGRGTMPTEGATRSRVHPLTFHLRSPRHNGQTHARGFQDRNRIPRHADQHFCPHESRPRC